MILATTNTVPGREVAAILGLARGNTIRTRHVGRDILAGEVAGYTKLMAESREQALARMIEHAESLGADAVVGLRVTTQMVMQGASEILVYGTAVRLR